MSSIYDKYIDVFALCILISLNIILIGSWIFTLNKCECVVSKYTVFYFLFILQNQQVEIICKAPSNMKKIKYAI